MATTLEALIRDKVTLGRKANNGFEGTKCAVCNDYKVRGGFKFDSAAFVYNCFNCGTKAVQHNNALSISNAMVEVFEAFGIDVDAATVILAQNRFTLAKTVTPIVTVNKVQQVVNLPSGSYKLSEAAADDPWAEVADAWLESRGLTRNSHDFYLSTDPLHRSRLIIPFYQRNQLVYWQARTMDDQVKVKYLNPSADKSGVIFNIDELQRHTTDMLFVCEGVFDALSIGQSAVGMCGSSLNLTKIQLLKKVYNRKIVFVIDLDAHATNGYDFGMTALNNEWDITFVEGYKDVNDALVGEGRLVTLASLNKNIMGGLEGKLRLGLMFVKQLEEKKKKKNELRKAKAAAVLRDQ